MSYKRRRVPKFDFYATGKKTFENHLVELLKEPFYKKIKDICDGLKEKNKTNSKILKAFQAEMAGVKKWDYDDLKRAAKFVVNKSKSSYIPKLIRTVVISNTKLLTATSSRKKVEVEINTPEPIAFFQRCFIEIGKSFYIEPFLICDAGQQPGLRLKNITDSLALIENSIRKTINSFLPMENILDIYLAQAEEDSDSEDEPEPEQPESDNESESEIDSESENESQHGGSESEIESEEEEESEDEENTEEIDLEDNTQDDESVHSEGGIVDLTEDAELIKQNDLVNDEEMSISEDLPDEFNLIPMKSETQSEVPSAPASPKSEQKPQEEEVKTIMVKKVGPTEATSNITKSDKMVFFDDAEDL